MINGEGTVEIQSSGATSPPGDDPLDDELLPPWEGQKSDDGDEIKSADFSSCGGESEFERYCSANSVLGTPSSVGSSSVYDFADSEFGSFKSFKLGGENRSVKNFVVDKQLLRNSGSGGSSNTRSELFDGKRGNDVKEFKGFLGIGKGMDFCVSPDDFWNDSEVGLVGNDNLGWEDNDGVGTWKSGNSFRNDGIGENLNAEETERGLMNLGNTSGSLEARETGDGSNVVNCEKEEEFYSRRGVELADGCLEGSDLWGQLDYDGGDVGRCLDECETSLRDEHSGDDDSMFGEGSDDGRKADLKSMINVKYGRMQESHTKNENGLFMTSAVAFGRDDWDDFAQETAENPLNIMVRDEFLEGKQERADNDNSFCHSASTITSQLSAIGFREEVLDNSRISNKIQESGKIEQSMNFSLSNHSIVVKSGGSGRGDLEDNQVNGINELAGYPVTQILHKNYEMDHNFANKEISPDKELSMVTTHLEIGYKDASTLEVLNVNHDLGLEHDELEEKNLIGDPLSDSVSNQLYSSDFTKDRMAESFKENGPLLLSDKDSHSIMENSHIVFNHIEDHFSPVKRDNSELNEFFDEMVHEMEEILLDTGKSPGSTFPNNHSTRQLRIPVPSRDGGSTSSTSGTDEISPLIQLPIKIDGVEVIGARQKQGDVSLGERLVGVKEYTIYRIRVWNKEENWEVERRYRDFCSLYHQLKKLFHDEALVLPSPWSSVEKESRKIFGNASPNVVADRSVLIQECLQSVLHLKMSSYSLNALIHFLAPSNANPISPSSVASLSQLQCSPKGTDIENVPMLGSTISLVVHLRPYKSLKQLLEVQHHTCGGCHKNLEEGKTRMKEIVQTFGWGKPRLCEYSGQLFCSSCHNNDTAVLPARVLHLWDFTLYPVSQLSKSYLDSIFDKPMLCVSAVNPLLFTRVPALQHVRNVRKKIGTMLPFIHCPFHRSILQGLGSRRYLLESSDFFALRDLIDLSKGMFAALPVIVETVSRKIVEHITEQCLICCDSGIPCNARQACTDPSALIFPFQEKEIKRCRSCDSVFHRHCFGRIVTCPCGAHLKPDEASDISTGNRHTFAGDIGRSLSSTEKKADASPGFLSGLFWKATQ